MQASGAHYAIDRRIHEDDDRVLVQDTITNTAAAPVGIILSNRIEWDEGENPAYEQLPNPTVFLATEAGGIGMVALDDVYLEQHQTFFEERVAGLRTASFALDTGASYTLEWAVYVNATGDYYDFVNAVRRDEGLVRTVEGNFAFIDIGEPPSEEFVRLRALKYASIPCLSHVADDAGISVEGIEFTEYPQECTRLQATMAETRRRFPEVHVMFHIAHSLYATDRPDELFPESRVLNANGQQTDYGGNNLDYYRKYFSAEHVDSGYRWFIFYPSTDNRFGRAMLDATEHMLDELGATGMFGDGLTHGYGGRFTYDRWDGHTAEIDPRTKTITRKYASVNLLADPILIEVVHKIQAHGGTVIANSYPGTRTFHQENVLYCIETSSGDGTLARLHLAPTCIGLGDPTRIECERDVYYDIRDKIEHGALYFYYSEGELTHPTVTAQMYPITVETLRPGALQGPERIVISRSGVYGWAGDRHMHRVYRYDGRGVEAPHGFVTTHDAGGVRTQVTLDENETAVVTPIPAALAATEAVNARVDQYDAEGIRIVLNGRGACRLQIASGAFAVTQDTPYVLTIGVETRKLTADAKGLEFEVVLDGQTEVAIRTERSGIS